MLFPFTLKNEDNFCRNITCSIELAYLEQQVEGITQNLVNEFAFHLSDLSCIDFKISNFYFGDIDNIEKIYFSILNKYPVFDENSDVPVELVNEINNLRETDEDDLSAFTGDHLALFGIKEEEYNTYTISEYHNIGHVICYSDKIETIDFDITEYVKNCLINNKDTICFRLTSTNSYSNPVAIKKKLLNFYMRNEKIYFPIIRGIHSFMVKKEISHDLDRVSLDKTAFINVLPNNEVITEINVFNDEEETVALNYYYNNQLSSIYYEGFKVLSNLHGLFYFNEKYILYKDIFGNLLKYHQANPAILNKNFNLSIDLNDDVYYCFSNGAYIIRKSNDILIMKNRNSELEYSLAIPSLSYSLYKVVSVNNYPNKYNITWNSGLVKKIYNSVKKKIVFEALFTNGELFSYLVNYYTSLNNLELLFNNENKVLNYLNQYQRNINNLVNYTDFVDIEFHYTKPVNEIEKDEIVDLIEIEEKINNYSISNSINENVLLLETYKILNNEKKRIDYKKYVKSYNYLDITGQYLLDQRVYFDNDQIFLKSEKTNNNMYDRIHYYSRNKYYINNLYYYDNELIELKQFIKSKHNTSLLGTTGFYPDYELEYTVPSNYPVESEEVIEKWISSCNGEIEKVVNRQSILTNDDHLNSILGDTAYHFNTKNETLYQKFNCKFTQGDLCQLETWILGSSGNSCPIKIEIIDEQNNLTIFETLLTVTEEIFKPYLFLFKINYSVSKLKLQFSLQEEASYYLSAVRLSHGWTNNKDGHRIINNETIYDVNNNKIFEKNGSNILEYKYNENGLLEYVFDNKNCYINRLYYDDNNRIIKKEFKCSDDKILFMEYEYYENGLLKSEKDNNGNKTIYNYDYIRRLIDVVYPDGKSIKYNYDDYSNVIKNALNINDYLEFTEYIFEKDIINNVNINGKEEYLYTYDNHNRNTAINYKYAENNIALVNKTDYFNTTDDEDNTIYNNILFEDGLIPNVDENEINDNYKYDIHYKSFGEISSEDIVGKLPSESYKNYYYEDEKLTKTYYYDQDYNSYSIENEELEFGVYKEVKETSNPSDGYNMSVTKYNNDSKELINIGESNNIYLQRNGYSLFDEFDKFNMQNFNDYILGIMSKPLYTKEVSYSSYKTKFDSVLNTNVLKFSDESDKIILPLSNINYHRQNNNYYNGIQYKAKDYNMEKIFTTMVYFKVDSNDSSIITLNNNKIGLTAHINQNHLNILVSVSNLDTVTTTVALTDNTNLDLNKWHLLYLQIMTKDDAKYLSYKIDDSSLIESEMEIKNVVFDEIILGSSNTEINSSVHNNVYVSYFSVSPHIINEDQLNLLFNNINKYLYENLPNKSLEIIQTDKDYDQILFNENLVSIKGVSPVVYNYCCEILDNINTTFVYDSELKKNVLDCRNTLNYDYRKHENNRNDINPYFNKKLGYQFNFNSEFNFYIKFKYLNNENKVKHCLLYNVKDDNVVMLFVENNILKIQIVNESVNETIVFDEIVFCENNWNSVQFSYFDSTVIIKYNNIVVEKQLNYQLNLSNMTTYLGLTNNCTDNLEGYIEFIKYSGNSQLDLSLNELVELNTFTNKYGLLSKELIKIDNNQLVKQYEYINSYNNDFRIPNKTINYDCTTTYYAYDQQGLLRRITKLSENDNILLKNEYDYDYQGRLQKEVITNNEEDDLSKILEYVYDNFGNILTIKEYTLNYVLIRTVNFEYSADIPNTLKKVYEVVDTNTNELFNFSYFNDYPFTLSSYINNGETLNIKYYGKNIVEIGNNKFRYDSLGNRIYKESSNGTKINYYYNNDKIIYTSLNIPGLCIDKVTYLYNDNNVLIGLKVDNKYYFYDRDVTGLINGIVDMNGNVMVKYYYSAFGKPIIKIPSGLDNDSYQIANMLSQVNIFLYKGYVYDVETQLYWVSSRYYSPELCRWISPDSIEYLDPESINGLNLYAYCGNDPVNNYDPTGHFTLPNWAKWVIGGVAFAGAVAAIAVITVASGGTAAPILIGAGIGALTSAGISAGMQLATTGTIDVGQLLVDTAVGGVMGAFGGSALGIWGMAFAGAGTSFVGSIAGDLVAGNSIDWGAAGISAGAGFVFALVGGPGAQNGKISLRARTLKNIKISKQKFATGKFTSQQFAQSQKDLLRVLKNRTYKLNSRAIKEIYYGIYTSLITGIMGYPF